MTRRASTDLGIDSIVLIGVVAADRAVARQESRPERADQVQLDRRGRAVPGGHARTRPRQRRRLQRRATASVRRVSCARLPHAPPASAPAATSRFVPAFGAGQGRHPRLDSAGAHGANFPVAVIGIACRFPGATDKETFWRNLAAGVDSVSTVPPSRWDTQALYARRHEPGKTVSQWGGFIEGVERVSPALFGLGPGRRGGSGPAHPSLHGDQSRGGAGLAVRPRLAEGAPRRRLRGSALPAATPSGSPRRASTA